MSTSNPVWDYGDLALVAGRTQKQTFSLMLIDPTVLYNRIVDYLNQDYDRELGYTDINFGDPYRYRKEVYGYIALEPMQRCPDVLQVDTVTAKSGYGPLLYDSAMMWTRRPIAPHRKRVSRSASNVWKFYFEHREDVVAESLPSRCQTHPRKPWLDYAYNLQGEGLTTGMKPALKRGHDLAADLVKLSKLGPRYAAMDRSDVEDFLFAVGSSIWKENPMHLKRKLLR